MIDDTTIPKQKEHGILPRPNGEELSRQLFISSIKRHLANKVAPGIRSTYDAKLKPAWSREHGKEPDSWRDVKDIVEDDPYYRMWGSMQRSAQEQMWNSVRVNVDRTGKEMRQRYEDCEQNIGSLTLDPDLEMPAYLTAVDIHCMAGSYHGETGKNDVTAGAVYDRGVWLYTSGRIGDLNDDAGRSMCNLIRRRFPDMKPRRILDMGCTCGNSTLPYVDQFPDAEIHAIDVAAPVLRYAHARAESLGKAVHFGQQNAERTNFPDGHFDVVVSHILQHETSNKAFRNIIREAHRLLRPGGIMLHAEVPPYVALDPFDAFMFDWDSKHNNEPFWTASHELDPVEIAIEAGFSRDSVFEDSQSSSLEDVPVNRSGKFSPGDFGGSGLWYAWGAVKEG